MPGEDHNAAMDTDSNFSGALALALSVARSEPRLLLRRFRVREARWRRQSVGLVALCDDVSGACLAEVRKAG